MRRGGSSITFMMTGYHVGGVLTALLAIPVLPSLGWRHVRYRGSAGHPARTPDHP
jgi:MFS transporter, AAHS family, benzoate transport protein